MPSHSPKVVLHVGEITARTAVRYTETPKVFNWLIPSTTKSSFTFANGDNFTFADGTDFEFAGE